MTISRYLKYIRQNCVGTVATAFVAAAALLVSGCHSAKSTVDVTTVPSGGQISAPVTPGAGNTASSQTLAATEKQRALVSRLSETYTGWQDFYAPVTFSLTSPKNVSISGRMTMVRDKEIYISLRMLGFEVAQIYVNTEVVYLVEKYHKYYYTESLSKLLGGYDISVGDLQDLLLGRAFLPGDGTLGDANIGRFAISAASDGTLRLSPATPVKGCDWYYTVSATEPPLLTALTLPVSGGDVKCEFGTPVHSPGGIISSSIDITAPVKGTEVQADIEIDTGSSKWNTGRTIDFKKPSSSYKLINVPAMLENLDKL